MPLAALAGSVREGHVTAESLVAESLGRIERLDGPVNAVIRLRGDGAFADAAVTDARVGAGDDPGPLAGLPLLVKDNEDAAGLPTTFGSLLRAEGEPVERDAEIVGRLRAAGAIVVGKTNLPEFAFEGFTSNRLHGDTRNPWALDWSPGGSSGGSGAALVAGLAPIATATDGGGSIRIPAAFCGLVGLKPTGGLIGRDPAPSWLDLSTKGPLTVSVADASLLLDVVRGPAAGDPTAVPTWTPRPDAWPARLLATPRMIDYGPLPEPIGSLFAEALANLATATGLEVEHVPPPFTEQIDLDWFTTAAVDELTWLGRDLVIERADELTPYLRGALELAAGISVDEYLGARRRRFADTRVLDGLLGSDAVLVSPTMCVEGIYADGRSPARTRSALRPAPTTRRRRTSRATPRSRCRPAARRTACRSGSRSPAPASPTTSCWPSAPRGKPRTRGRSLRRGSRPSASDRAERDEPVHEPDEHGAADHVPDRGGGEVRAEPREVEALCRHVRPDIGLEQQARRDEVHVGDRVLEMRLCLRVHTDIVTVDQPSSNSDRPTANEPYGPGPRSGSRYGPRSWLALRAEVVARAAAAASPRSPRSGSALRSGSSISSLRRIAWFAISAPGRADRLGGNSHRRRVDDRQVEHLVVPAERAMGEDAPAQVRRADAVARVPHAVVHGAVLVACRRTAGACRRRRSDRPNRRRSARRRTSGTSGAGPRPPHGAPLVVGEPRPDRASQVRLHAADAERDTPVGGGAHVVQGGAVVATVPRRSSNRSPSSRSGAGAVITM